MKSMKRGLALLLAAVLMIPNTLPVSAKELTAMEVSGEVKKTVPEEAAGDEKSPEVSSGNETETKTENDEADEGNTKAVKETGQENRASEEIGYNTGNHVYSVVSKDDFVNQGLGDTYFEEDGSCTIPIPELNPFFPYEVQFTYQGETKNEWFMTPQDSVEIGGHTFYVSAEFDNTAVTQMSLKVAGDVVVVYPESKEFTNEAGKERVRTTVSGNLPASDQAMVSGNVPDAGMVVPEKNVPPEGSLMPLERRDLSVDLSGYTPVELTMVSFDSIFTGENQLKDTDKVVWKRRDYNGDDFTITPSDGIIDLSCGTSSSWYESEYGFSTESMAWEMIVGVDDQLEADNIRYLINLETKDAQKWLLPTVYIQDSVGKRTKLDIPKSYYYDSYTDKTLKDLDITLAKKDIEGQNQAYVGLQINPAVYASTRFEYMKVYEGKFSSTAEAVNGKEITNQICSSDMQETNSGYLMKLPSERKWVTIVTYDAKGDVTGCLPFEIRLTWSESYISSSSMRTRTDDGTKYVENSRITRYDEEGVPVTTIELYKGYPANAEYGMSMSYYKSGVANNGNVTAAYIGKYASMAEAQAAKAKDIKDSLFTKTYDGGYYADYSQGVYFTIFVGEDESNEQEIYRSCYKTVEGNEVRVNNNVAAYFNGLKDREGNEIDVHIIDTKEDSYAEYNYLTMLVDKDVDLTGVAPTFSDYVKLYTEGRSTPEISGESIHDFSKGPVQYTAVSEDGEGSKNYWLQIVKATDGEGWIYINSLADLEAGTKNENGITYSTREVRLDGYHDDVHDIVLANMGTEALAKLSAEVVSDSVELDGYWTLKGSYGLEGFDAESLNNTNQSNDTLPNLAKIRLKAKQGIEAGKEISGTLTIKSDEKTLLVLNLTGTVGDPCIITKEIPSAVKYVPYGTVIQNNNKYYSWNTVDYRLLKGTLPKGMEVRKSGEIYGVPKETGEFTFTVEMYNSSGQFTSSTREFTLIVEENTDPNVDGATDENYDISQRVQDITINSDSDQTLVSEGTFEEFVDIYLDGEKLKRGEDYTAESGSTRITIRSQTLKASNEEGTHTLGVEFRTQDTDTLKRAAQNYQVNSAENNNGGDNGNGDNGNNNGGDNGNGNNGNSNGGNNGNGNSGNNNGGNNGNGNSAGKTGMSANKNGAGGNSNGAVNTISYTVQAGDTLWKIAEKYYGSGAYWEKIFKDNEATINDPNKIYAGQVIIIYLTIDGEAAASEGGIYYTVQSGDTLWKIAKQQYGKGWRWRKIYQANKDKLTSAENIYEGQIIFIPEN